MMHGAQIRRKNRVIGRCAPGSGSPFAAYSKYKDPTAALGGTVDLAVTDSGNPNGTAGPYRAV
ncbi:MAG: hypothetical protein ACYC6Y_00225 [Thermoguttaceae bacterium]